MSLVALAFVLVVPQTTWVVDGNNGPGTNFTDLPPAVAAAAHGDTVLVRAGNYGPFVSQGKALTIRGAGATGPGATHVFDPALPIGAAGGVIESVPPGSVFTIDGIDIGAAYGAGLIVRGPASTVAIADCVAFGGVFFFTGYPGLSVDDATVTAVRSAFRASPSATLGGIAASGASIGNATLLAVDCDFSGSSVTPIKAGVPGNGGSGIAVTNGRSLLFQCTVRGGASGNGNGGAGIDLVGSFTRVAGDAGAFVIGGAGVSGNGFAIRIPADGSSAIVHGPVQLVPLPGNATLGAPALPRLDVAGTATASGELVVGQPVTVTLVSGLANAPVALGFAALPSVTNALAPQTLGELHLPVSAFLWLLPADAQGRLQLTFGAGVTPALIGLPVFAQVGVLDFAGSRIRMSNLDLHLFTL